MKALLKNGEWVEIDTTCLFNNQYNAAGKRIFDQDIKRIVDDVNPVKIVSGIKTASLILKKKDHSMKKR